MNPLLRQTVVARKVTRYYVFGKGYASESLAYRQLAKRHLSLLYCRETRAIGQEHPSFSQWQASRYPRQIGCKCICCQRVDPKPHLGGFHCWFAKKRELALIGNEIKLGIRGMDGFKTLCLPAPGVSNEP